MVNLIPKELVSHIKLDLIFLSDEELVKIFELGLKVRESAILTVDNQKMVEDVLDSKSTGDPHKRLVFCLFVRNIKKCRGVYWRVLYRKLISRNV